jgi:multiple sugar transport system permease protein
MLFVSGILLVCAWTLVPIYLVALGGIGGAATVYAWPKPFWPAGLSFGNFAAFLQIEGLWPAMLRSVEVAVMCMALSLVLGAPAGYALARFAFRGANVYRLMILMTRAFPVGILALPLAVGFVRTALALPFAVLVTSSLFLGIPRELEEAAWVFGCSGPGAFRRVVLPLAVPGIAATAIFAFVISWNEVFAASVLTVRNKTLTAYLLTLLSEAPLQSQLAGGLLLILPSVFFIFIVRRYLFAIWGVGNR